MSGPGVAQPRAADERLSVLIADDHPLMLAGIRRALERSAAIEVIGEALSGPELLELVERRRPRIVLMDLRMPGVEGTSCIAQLRARWPKLRIVVLSAVDDRQTVERALAAGADAYVVKAVRTSDIGAVLQQAASDAVFHVSPGARSLQSEGASERPAPALTERERTILAAVAAGKTTAAISRELWISEHTVKFHLTSIYRKLGVANRAGAVRCALAAGLLAA
jgi:DNA-binding NarL/FixJ family response regulator